MWLQVVQCGVCRKFFNSLRISFPVLRTCTMSIITFQSWENQLMMNFLKAILAGTAIFLGVQVGRDLAHKTMAATSSTPTAQ